MERSERAKIVEEISEIVVKKLTSRRKLKRLVKSILNKEVEKIVDSYFEEKERNETRME